MVSTAFTLYDHPYISVLHQLYNVYVSLLVSGNNPLVSCVLPLGGERDSTGQVIFMMATKLRTWWESKRTCFGRVERQIKYPKSGSAAKRLAKKEQWVYDRCGFLRGKVDHHTNYRSSVSMVLNLFFRMIILNRLFRLHRCIRFPFRTKSTNRLIYSSIRIHTSRVLVKW